MSSDFTNVLLSLPSSCTNLANFWRLLNLSVVSFIPYFIFLPNHTIHVCFLEIFISLPMVFFYEQVEGTPERPRMSVFRSNKHIYVQVVDDTRMHTLAAASTMQKSVSEEVSYSSGPTIVSRVGFITPF